MKRVFDVVIPQGWRLDLPNTGAAEQYALIESLARKAEELGFQAAWLYDHFHTYPKIERASVFEAWTTLTALAKATSSLRLGVLVTCNSYRNPALLAKMAATLDVISGGRLEFGIGAGWYEAEYKAFGYDFPGNAARIRMLDEAVQIIKRMWVEDSVTFFGRYYRVEGALNYPKPLQKPRPRVLIGGAGESLTLKVVARHADRWNTGGDPETYQRKMEKLHNYLEEAGRKTSDVECTYHGIVVVEESDEKALARLDKLGAEWGLQEPRELAKRNPVGSPEKVADYISRLYDIGVTRFMLYPLDAASGGKLEYLRDHVLNLV